jgi:serine/threonine protein kinase
MEYLQGIDLENLVKRYGALPDGRVVNILRQICGSLAEAHSIGLIHRDIKPANIILTNRAGVPDFVKVLDFGLVKTIDESEATKLTQANSILGTPHYMSPESVEHSDRVDALSDIYAIGAVGYYLLTGTTVFSGKTIMDVCMKHVRAAPDAPSKRVGHAIAPAIEAVLLRCLAKSPADRPPSAQALADELDRCKPSQPWTIQDGVAWWAAFAQPTSSATIAHQPDETRKSAEATAKPGDGDGR